LQGNIKVFIIIGAIVFSIALVCLVCYFIILFSAQKRITDGSRDYTPVEIVSDDGKFILKINKETGATGTFVSFNIETTEDKKLIYECPDKYRAYDLKSIKWDSRNVLVVSSDVGTITYHFINDTWVKATT